MLTSTDATHIFDGLKSFPTHVAHLQLGTTTGELHKWSPNAKQEDLYNLALGWTREDRDLRREQEKEKGRMRGPRLEVSLIASSVSMTSTVHVSALKPCRHSLYQAIPIVYHGNGGF